MARSRQAKAMRRIKRDHAYEAIKDLSDEELKNLKHELGREITSLQKRASQLRVRLDAVYLEIGKRSTATAAGIHITDHAVVRYLERHKGVDIAAIRDEIGEIAARARLASGGTNGVRVDEETGLSVGVNENDLHVTTVYFEKEMVVRELCEED